MQIMSLTRRGSTGWGSTDPRDGAPIVEVAVEQQGGHTNVHMLEAGILLQCSISLDSQN